MTTIKKLRRNQWFTIIFDSALAIFLALSLVFAKFNSSHDHITVAVIVVIIDIAILYNLLIEVVGWNDELSFQNDLKYFLIKKNSHQDKVPFSNILSIDARSAKWAVEIIKYRADSNREKTFKFVPYDTPEIRQWHRFLRGNKQIFENLMTPKSQKLHNKMDQQQEEKYT